MVLFHDYILVINRTSALDQQSDSYLAILVYLVVCSGCKIINVLLNCENYMYHLILLSPEIYKLKVALLSYEIFIVSKQELFID